MVGRNALNSGLIGRKRGASLAAMAMKHSALFCRPAMRASRCPRRSARVERVVPNRGRARRAVFLALSMFAALAGHGCSKEVPATKDQILSRAQAAFAGDRFFEAEKSYREVLQLAPEDALALRQLGTLYLEQGQMIQAYPLLKKINDLQPDDPELQLKLGEAALAVRQLEEARDLAQRVLEKRAGDETALLLLVDTALTTDEINETRALIEGLREKDQDRANYHLALGVLDLKQNNDNRAENGFRAALKLAPKSGAVYSALGRLYLTRNDLSAAENAMKTAAELSPLRSPLQLRYLEFILSRGELAEAKALLERINTKFPDYLPARVYLMKIACSERIDENCATRVQDILARDPTNFDAEFHDSILDLVKGDTSRAILQLEHLNEVYRDKPKLLYQLAVAYLASVGHAGPVDARDAIDKAASRLTEAIKLDPHYSEAVLMYAELQVRSGNATAVIDLLQQLIKEQPQIANGHYLLAAAYRAVHEDGQALTVFQQMASLFPKDPRPPLGAGEILIAQKRATEGRNELEKSIAISPEYLPATEAIVNLDIAEKKYDAAKERVQRLIEKNGTQALLWGLRGKIYLAQNDMSHAEADLLKAINLDPKLEPAYLLLADVYETSNRQDQAIAKLSEFIENSKSVPALLRLAKLYEMTKNFRAARETYEKLIAQSADHAEALNNLALIDYEQFGQLNTAYDLAQRARELAPNDPHVADTLGWILFKKGEYRNALPLLKESAAAMPDVLEHQFHLGMTHYMLGQEEEARTVLQRAIGSGNFPGKDEARQRIAVLAIDRNTNSAAARLQLTNVLQRWPNDPAALMRLAQLQIREGESDQAVKTLEKIVSDDPYHGPALRQLAFIYAERSVDDQKAYELIQRARESYPDDASIAKTLGILSYRRQLFPRSAELLQDAARTLQDDPELLYYLGAARLQLKQWDECKAALERALNLALPSGLAEKVKQGLAECSDPPSP